MCRLTTFSPHCFQEEEEYIRKAAAKGVVLNHTDDLFIPHKNRLEEDELEGTGLDAAVDLLAEAVSGKASVDEHPERRRKVRICFLMCISFVESVALCIDKLNLCVLSQALYNAYYERELVAMKEDLPGLKLSQYKDRIFENWNKSPENPANQAK